MDIDDLLTIQHLIDAIRNSAEMLVIAMGMQAENAIREQKGESPAYDKEVFDQLVNKYR
jgi:hypothetical protein